MKYLALIGLAGGVLFASRPALASPVEPPPSSSVSGVTVIAPAKPSPLVSPESQFVRQHLPQGKSDQLARFRDDVCVSVQGLPAEFDAFIAKRIVDVATKVHAPVSKAENCTPNVDVIFTTQPQAQLTDLAKRKDIVLGFYWNNASLKRLATFNRPIGAWYLTRTRDDAGQSQLEIHDPIAWQSPRVGRAGSRLSNGMSAEVVHTLILADANKVAGEKIDSIADYIAVLALARWQGLERCNVIPTILNLMADGCEADAPEAATEADLALLTGLYAVDPRELGSQQRATIADGMHAAAAAAANVP